MLARAGGSPRNAIMLADYGGVEIAEALDKLVDARDPAAAETHRLADAVAGRDQAIPFGIFNAHALDLLARAASEAAERGDIGTRRPHFRDSGSDARIAILDTETYNLDRKQHVLSMIARLNDTFRM